MPVVCVAAVRYHVEDKGPYSLVQVRGLVTSRHKTARELVFSLKSHLLIYKYEDWSILYLSDI